MFHVKHFCNSATNIPIFDNKAGSGHIYAMSSVVDPLIVGGRSVAAVTDAADRAAKQQIVLAAFMRGASYHAAAQAAGITRMTIYNWREADEEYDKAVAAAIQCGTDAMEDEARRRAMGWSEPVFNAKGKKIGEQFKASDRLMEFLLMGRRPEKFRPEKNNIVLNATQNNQTLNAVMSPEVTALLERVAQSKAGGFDRGKGET